MVESDRAEAMRAIRRILLIRLKSSSLKAASHPQGIHLPFTLKYLQSLLIRRGYDVQWFDCHTDPLLPQALLSKITRSHPHVAVISSTPLERPLLSRVAAALRDRCGAFTIAVGQDVSLEPALYLDGSSPVDLAIPGEAEQVCAEAIDSLRDGMETHPLQKRFHMLLKQRRSVLVEHPDELPFPVYAPGELLRYPHAYPIPMGHRAVWGHLLASRGCPYPCAFCTQMNRESYGARVRLRGPAHVVREMEYLQGLGATVLAFDDDNLTTDPKFVEALCLEILQSKLRLPWIAHSRVDNLNPELAARMRHAGCSLLRFGIESATPRIVRLLRKGGTASSWQEAARKAVSTASQAGIPTLGLFIIGNPTETRQEILETLRLALELPLDLAQVHFFTPYPGTFAYEQTRQQIEPDAIAQQHHYLPPKVNLSSVETQSLVKLRAFFYRRFYGRPGWMARHLRRYARFYLANPSFFRGLLVSRNVFLG